jgi:hypothetical protein
LHWVRGTGGRKKKLKQSMPSTDVTVAGLLPQTAATKRTTSRYASATVVVLCVA